jgi:hypothetical protein
MVCLLGRSSGNDDDAPARSGAARRSGEPSGGVYKRSAAEMSLGHDRTDRRQIGNEKTGPRLPVIQRYGPVGFSRRAAVQSSSLTSPQTLIAPSANPRTKSVTGVLSLPTIDSQNSRAERRSPSFSGWIVKTKTS